MKKTLYILFFAFVLNSCQNEKKLNGTWISAYQYGENDTLNYDLSGTPFNQILEIQDGILTIHEFKFDSFGDSSRSHTFKIKGNRLILNDSEEYLSNIIEPIAKDSFQLSSLNYGGMKSVYKRLHDSLKKKSVDFQLSGNRYERTFKKWTDTIHFINDSVFVSSGWERLNSELNWQRVNINGFDVLFTDIYIPFVLTDKSGNRIQVTTFDRKEEKYVLKQIE